MRELEDGTIVYTREEAKVILDKIAAPKINAAEGILLLLAVTDKPIYGRIKLFKELFLLEKEVFNKNSYLEHMQFVPYRFGPYSFRVGHLLEDLEMLGLILRKGKKNTGDESFSITEKGRKYIARLFDELPKDLLEEVKKRRIGWDELGSDGILRYVYQHYPEYKQKSELKEKYKTITWGRGRG